jgi:hypothetical protein
VQGAGLLDIKAQLTTHGLHPSTGQHVEDTGPQMAPLTAQKILTPIPTFKPLWTMQTALSNSGAAAYVHPKLLCCWKLHAKH